MSIAAGNYFEEKKEAKIPIAFPIDPLKWMAG